MLHTFVSVKFIYFKYLQFFPKEVSDWSLIRGQFPMLNDVNFGQLVANVFTQSSSTFTHLLSKTCCKYLQDFAKFEIPFVWNRPNAIILILITLIFLYLPRLVIPVLGMEFEFKSNLPKFLQIDILSKATSVSLLHSLNSKIRVCSMCMNFYEKIIISLEI